MPRYDAIHCTTLCWCLKALTPAVIGLSYFVGLISLLRQLVGSTVPTSFFAFLCLCPVGYFVWRIKTLHVVKLQVSHMLFLANQSNENISWAELLPSLSLSLLPPESRPSVFRSIWASEGPWLPQRFFTRLILWILNRSDQQSASVSLSSTPNTLQT